MAKLIPYASMLWLIHRIHQILYPHTKCKYSNTCDCYMLNAVVCNDYSDAHRGYCGKFRRLKEALTCKTM